MPKVSSDTTEVPKRAPRRRVPRKTARPAALREVSEESMVTPRRKSPTSLSPKESTRLRGNRAMYTSLGVLLVSGVAAVVIGFSDKGQIDIQELIANQPPATESGTNENGDPTPVTIPVQNNPSTEPSGGLLPSADQTTPTPLPVGETTESASTTASSTDEVGADEATTDTPDEQATSSAAVNEAVVDSTSAVESGE